MKFICPKCGEKLNINECGAAVCAAGHSYDRSRYGYYNLLLSAAGGTHGDNREMIAARRDFLDTGAYAPLAKCLCSLVAEVLPDGGTFLDIGAGEGYYTALVDAELERRGKRRDVLAFDISKDAARFAARRLPQASHAVASAYKMPVADGSVDVAMNVFSPLAASEVVRVLRAGGHFVMAIPDARHLYGLKSVLYDKPYENTVSDAEIEGLRLKRTERVAYTLTLDGREKIRNLFMMTPYAYRTPRSASERLYSLDVLTTQIEFMVFVYEKPKFPTRLDKPVSLV